MGSSYRWTAGEQGEPRLVDATSLPAKEASEDPDVEARSLYEQHCKRALVATPSWEDLGTSRRLFWRALAERGLLGGTP